MMHDIGTMFAVDAWQKKHPCYILVPQYDRGQHWSMQETGSTVWALFAEVLRSQMDIDSGRIYIYGYSAGGVGTLRMVKEHPPFFAGAVSICGATGKSDLLHLKETPLWLVHAADDNIVKATYRGPHTRELAHYGSRDIYDALSPDAKDWDFHYTEYPQGWMKEHYGVNPHCSWVAVSDPANDAIREWLFAHCLRERE